MRVADKDLSVFFLYCYATAGWLAMQSAVLVLAPKVVINMLSEELHKASDTEIYFGRALGFTLSVLALIVLFFTGTIPVLTATSEPISLEEHDPKAPYAKPVVLATLMLHVINTIYCYVRYMNSGLAGYILGSVGYGGLACVAGFLVLFSDSSRVSSRTGEDKRTAGFPFSNRSAYDKSKDRKAR